MAGRKPQWSHRSIAIGCTIASLAGLAVARYWVALYPIFVYLPAATQPTTQPSGAEAADAFSSLSAIFTLLAFVGIVGALLFQRKDLDLQRQALDYQREDAVEQQKYLDQERKQAAKDQVRREVFQLLAAWQELVHHTGYKKETDGRFAFSVMAESVERIMKEARKGRALSRGEICDAYKRFYLGKNQDALGHYFRLLYHIVRRISESSLENSEQMELAKLVRGHLSEPEFTLLFWNGLAVHGRNMYALVEKFDLLQNFSFDEILDGEIKHYPKTHAQHEIERGRAVQWENEIRAADSGG